MLSDDDSNQTILKILFTLEPQYICHDVPGAISQNCTFVVDMEYLDNVEDIKCDDMESWKQSKCSTKYYDVEDSSDGEYDIIPVRDGLDRSYKVVRRTYINKSSPDLHKTMVLVQESQKKTFSKGYIKYWFERAEHAVQVLPHGNSKSKSTPYTQTYQSTTDKVKKHSRQCSSSKRLHAVNENEVGSLSVEKAGQLPRNPRQVLYEKNTSALKSIDPLQNVSALMKEEGGSCKEMFVRTYSLDDDSPKVVLFLDSQLDDICNFACNNTQDMSSVLGIDLTFELGPFFVLVTRYENIILENSTRGSSPSVIGPMMLCMLKNKETYVTLFQKMVARRPGLRVHLRSYETDSEVAIRDAAAQ